MATTETRLVRSGKGAATIHHRAALDLIERRANALQASNAALNRQWVAAGLKLEAAEQRATDMEKALRDEFFRLLPDLDYEEIIPGSEDEDGIDPVFDWAWARHPWFALLGLTRNEIHDWFDLQNRAALSAREEAQP